MRKSILAAALAALVTSMGWSQVLDRPAATVKLTKTQSITVSQLQKYVTPREVVFRRALTKDERRQALDDLIGIALIEQAGDRDKIVVSDAELSARIQDEQKNLGTAYNLGRPATQQQLQDYVRNNGMSWEDYQKQIKDQLLMLDYVRAKNRGVLESIKPATESDIQSFYDSHKKDEFIDDMAIVSHIYIDTRNLLSKDDKDKARQRAEDILKELKGGASFGDLVMKYSDDQGSKYKGGDIGPFMRSDPQRLQLFGKDFIDQVFTLKKGDVSDVLTSNVGLHIVKITNRIDAHLLTLDEKVPPQFQVTLHDYIKGLITNQRQNDALSAALNAIVTDLKKQADIHVFDDNLSW